MFSVDRKAVHKLAVGELDNGYHEYTGQDPGKAQMHALQPGHQYSPGGLW